MMMNRLTIFLVGAFSLGYISEAVATGALPDGPYLIAAGTAKTDVAPDYATLNLTVDGLAPTTSAASAIVDDKSDKVVVVLKKASIADEDIRASTLNVSPSYDYEGEKRVYKGQYVTRNFKVTLHDLKNFSSLIQGLLDADVDELNEVEFGSSKEADIGKHNLEAAIDKAREQADDMAARAGEHVDRIYGMAPEQYSNFITQQFPYEYANYGTAQLGKIEVTGTRLKRSEGYIIPKSITFSATVTIVCSVK